MQEIELQKEDQDQYITTLTAETSESRFEKQATAEELTRTRNLAEEANKLYYERLKTVSAGFERQSSLLERELESATDLLYSYQSRTGQDVAVLKEE